jgi:hypothetical protein
VLLAIVGILSGIIQIYGYYYGQGILVILLLLIVAIASIIVSLITSTSMIMVTKKLLDKQMVDEPKKMMNDAKKIIGGVFIVGLLVALIVIGGSILLFIPGLIFAIWYSFAVFEAVLNNKRGMEALSESKKLVSGRWWAILWRLIGPSIPLIIVVFVVQFIVGIIAVAFHSFAVSQLLTLIVNYVLYFFILPYSMSAQMMLYQDAKAKPVSGAMQK